MSTSQDTIMRQLANGMKKGDFYQVNLLLIRFKVFKEKTNVLIKKKSQYKLFKEQELK